MRNCSLIWINYVILIYKNVPEMYSICVKGKVFRPLVVTENHLILHYHLENYSNVIFPKKEISIVLNLREANISLDNALDMVGLSGSAGELSASADE